MAGLRKDSLFLLGTFGGLFFLGVFCVALFAAHAVFGIRSAEADTYSSTNFQVLNPAIHAGGGYGTSSSYTLEQAIGEFGLGYSTSSGFQIQAGFLAFPAASSDDSSSGPGDSGGGSSSAGGGGGPIGLFGASGGDAPPADTQVPATTTGEGDVQEPPALVPPTTIEGIADIIEPFIPPFLRPEPPRVVLPPPDVSASAPPVFARRWHLIRPETLSTFVFEPLPPSVRALAVKFPELGRTFAEVGIERLSDLGRLRSARLALPAFSELSRIPTEVVFARAGNKLVDFNLALDVDLEGDVRPRINTVSGQALSLAVRPKFVPRRIVGYLVLAEGAFGARGDSVPVPGGSALASVILSSGHFAGPVRAPREVEDRLLVDTFEYHDPEGDGIYTADANAPLVQGTYEVITVIEYEEAGRGARELRLTLVVDPEGYVYELLGGREVRIPDAEVELFWENPESGEFELWPAGEYQQKNPQVTGVTGEYSFLVPPGAYRLRVAHPDYREFSGEAVRVREGRGVHENIRLRSPGSIVERADPLWIIAGLLALVMLYNLYTRFRRSRTR